MRARIHRAAALGVTAMLAATLLLLGAGEGEGQVQPQRKKAPAPVAKDIVLQRGCKGRCRVRMIRTC